MINHDMNKNFEYLNKLFTFIKNKTMKTENLVLDLASAKQLYPNSSVEMKEIFEKTFGKDKLVPVLMRDRIKSIQDVYEICGVTEEDVCRVSAVDSLMGNADAIVGTRQLFLITKAFNGEWKPNWSDSNEYKYYPWFDMRSTGASHGSGRATTESSVGFVFVNALSDNSAAAVGSRLCFKNREDGEYAAKLFLDIYSKIYVIS